MEERKYIFEPTTLETRRESYDSVNTDLRQEQVLEILTKPMSAKEVAVEMFKKGYTQNEDRNNAAPRLHELENLGKVEIIGKEKCQYSGKTVSVYQKKENSVSMDKYKELLNKFDNLKCVEAYSQTRIKELKKENEMLRKELLKK